MNEEKDLLCVYHHHALPLTLLSLDPVEIPFLIYVPQDKDFFQMLRGETG